MPVVRYVALAALVVWLGGTMQALAGDAIARHLTPVAYVCGGVMLVALFVMKFVGPPPHGFVARAVLVALMLAVAALGTSIGTALGAGRGASQAALAVTTILGFTLLAWYAHE